MTQQAAVLGSLVSLVRGSQGLGLRGDRGGKHEQDHREPRPEWHPSCQASIIIPEIRRLTANEKQGDVFRGLGARAIIALHSWHWPFRVQRRRPSKNAGGDVGIAGETPAPR